MRAVRLQRKEPGLVRSQPNIHGAQVIQEQKVCGPARLYTGIAKSIGFHSAVSSGVWIRAARVPQTLWEV